MEFFANMDKQSGASGDALNFGDHLGSFWLHLGGTLTDIICFRLHFPTLSDHLPAPSPEEIQSYVGTQLSHYKQLHRVTFVEAIPKSPSGKILRRLLRDSL